ncbi:MAG: fumarate hydratase [Candidatus Thermoplasmatota archaeon]
MVSENIIKNTVAELLRRAVIKLPADVKASLEKAYKNEISAIAKMQLKAILDNIKLAEDANLPMCQDTGVIIFYVTNPVPNIQKPLVEGVREATKLIPLRPNAVHPITRKNPGDNIGERMPYINYSFSNDDFMEITAFPKGAGSENMSTSTMLTPAQGIKGVKEFVLNAVIKAGSQPCPPTIIGVGIGGSADIATKIAKEALLRPINQRHKDKEIAQLENELFEAINLLGIGPMGLGGKTTCLGVNIEYAYCHTASLPVAVNIQCWAARKASARIYRDGVVKYV